VFVEEFLGPSKDKGTGSRFVGVCQPPMYSKDLITLRCTKAVTLIKSNSCHIEEASSMI